MSHQPRTLICFDFGTKRIGVAVGQELTHTANALETINNINNKPDWDAINRIVVEWQPNAFVIGLPLNLDGTEHQLAGRVHNFANHLRERFKLPVYLMDERLSSVEAERIIAPGKKSIKQNKQTIDKIAAELILRSWLEQNK